MRRYVGERRAFGAPHVTVHNDDGAGGLPAADGEGAAAGSSAGAGVGGDRGSGRGFPLPASGDGTAGTFEWSERAGATELARAILTHEIGHKPPESLVRLFRWDVIDGLPTDGFELTADAVTQWAQQAIEGADLRTEPGREIGPPDDTAGSPGDSGTGTGTTALPPGHDGDAARGVPVWGRPAGQTGVADSGEPGEERAAPTASALVAACEDAWAAIQAHHPEVPDAVIVLGSGVERGRLVKLGHWWAGRWVADGDVRGEVLLAGEALHLTPPQVFEVLLHEAAHGLNAARGIKDTSRGGRYHNARFRDAAEELGLEVSALRPHGLARTELAPAGERRYGPAIARLGEAMRIARHLDRDLQAGQGSDGKDGGKDVGGNGRRSRGSQAATCGCGRRLRMAPSVLAAGPVLCGLCNQEFTLARQVEPAGAYPAEPASAELAGAERTGSPDAAPAQAVVDRQFLARRQAALVAERGDEQQPSADAGEGVRRRAAQERIETALHFADPEAGNGGLTPLQERVQRLARLHADKQTEQAPDGVADGADSGAGGPTAEQQEGMARLQAPADADDLAAARDWYARFGTFHEEPMPAGDDHQARRRQDLARALLKADGTLRGPAVTTGDHEFMRGDRIIATNLAAPYGVPAGVPGTVELIDPETGELQVDFATLGRLHMSASDAVRHGFLHDYVDPTARPDHQSVPGPLELERQRFIEPDHGVDL